MSYGYMNTRGKHFESLPQVQYVVLDNVFQFSVLNTGRIFISSQESNLAKINLFWNVYAMLGLLSDMIW